MLARERFEEKKLRFLNSLAIWYLSKNRGALEAAAHALKIQISEDVWMESQGQVVAGPFASMKTPLANGWSGSNDIAPMLWGTYEQSVQRFLLNQAGKHRHFIQLGAAWGYFAVGVAVAKLFDHVIAFEQDSSLRASLNKFAALNGVAIDIRGEANFATLESPREEGIDFADAIFLIDIEGSEIDLLSSEFVEMVRGATLIIELHPFAPNWDEARIQRLLSLNFDLHFLFPEYDLSGVPSSWIYSDILRGLLLSEGRPMLMRSLVALPKP